MSTNLGLIRSLTVPTLLIMWPITVVRLRRYTRLLLEKSGTALRAPIHFYLSVWIRTRIEPSGPSRQLLQGDASDTFRILRLISAADRTVTLDLFAAVFCSQTCVVPYPSSRRTARLFLMSNLRALAKADILVASL